MGLFDLVNYMNVEKNYRVAVIGVLRDAGDEVRCCDGQLEGGGRD